MPFLPSNDGFEFDNSWPPTEHFHLDVLFWDVPIGSAANGLCGGMCFAAADYFMASRPIPHIAEPPSIGSALYAYIVQRLWESFNLPAGPTRYLWAMAPTTGQAELDAAVVQDEWPAIKAGLDAGVPQTVNLVQVKSANPGDLGQNHQVLAYRYEESGTQVRLFIYDPNFGAGSRSEAERNDRKLVFDAADPRNIGLRYEPARPRGDMPDTPVFSFFHSEYRPAAPPGPDAERVADFQGWSARGSLPMGVTAAGDPTIASNADGRLEIFVPGSDDQLWHCWELAPNGGFSEWHAFGGRILGKLAWIQNADGRMEVFGRGTDRNVWHRWQQSGGGWSGWRQLHPGGWAFRSSPAVGRNVDGRVEVFAVGLEGALHHTWQTGGGWSDGWTAMGGDLTGDPAIAANDNGALEIFCQGANHAIWHAWQPEPAQSWGNWEDLGGNKESSPSVAVNRDGRLEVFARGVDHKLWRRWQAWPRGPWTPPWWEGTDAPNQQRLDGDPVAGRLGDGRLIVFCRALNGRLYARIQETPGGQWHPWFDLYGDGFEGNPSMATAADGRPVVAACRHDQVWLNFHG